MTAKILEVPKLGAQVYATKAHHEKKRHDYIGEIIEISGNILFFRDAAGETDCVIWRDNQTIMIGVDMEYFGYWIEDKGNGYFDIYQNYGLVMQNLESIEDAKDEIMKILKED